MSAETFTPTVEAKSPAEILQDTASYIPKSPQDALEMVQLVEGVIPMVEKSINDGEQIDQQAAEELSDISQRGIDHWKLGEDQVQVLSEVAQGGRPPEFTGTDKEWYNTGMEERRAIKQDANKRLRLSEQIIQHEVAAEKQAVIDGAHGEAITYDDKANTAMQEHLQSVSDAAYSAKESELRASTTARLEKARNNPHLSENARHTVVTAIEQEIEAAAATAAETAARERQAVIDANGGAHGLEKLLRREIKEAVAQRDREIKETQERHEREKRIAQLKRIHGSDYENRYDENGVARPKNVTAPAEKPEKPVQTEAERVAFLKRIHGDDYDNKFDEHGVSRKGTSAEYASAPESIPISTFSTAGNETPGKPWRFDVEPEANNGGKNVPRPEAAGAVPAFVNDVEFRSNLSNNVYVRRNGVLERAGVPGFDYPVDDDYDFSSRRTPEAAGNKYEPVIDAIGDTAVNAVVEKPSFFKRFKVGNTAKADKPKKHKWEPRKDFDTLVPRESSRVGKPELHYAAEDLYAEELRNLTPKARAEYIARLKTQEAAAEAAANPKEKVSLKDRAKNVRGKFKVRRKNGGYVDNGNWDYWFNRDDEDDDDDRF